MINNSQHAPLIKICTNRGVSHFNRVMMSSFSGKWCLYNLFFISPNRWKLEGAKFGIHCEYNKESPAKNCKPSNWCYFVIWKFRLLHPINAQLSLFTHKNLYLQISGIYWDIMAQHLSRGLPATCVILCQASGVPTQYYAPIP